MDTFHLEDHPHVALHHLLKLVGWCESGGAAKHAISVGLVRVDGEVELRKSRKVLAGQTVAYGGQQVTVEP